MELSERPFTKGVSVLFGLKPTPEHPVGNGETCCSWSNSRHTTVIKCQTIKTDEFKFDESPKYKLYVRLKLPEKGLPGFQLRKFVNALLRTMKYDECLIIELNDAVASAICNELKFQEKTPIGVLQDDSKNSRFSLFGRHDCSLQEECYKIRLNGSGNKKNVIYSYFKILILTPSVEQFQIQLSKDMYACDIMFKTRRSGIENTSMFAKVYIEPTDKFQRSTSISFQDALDNENLGLKIYEEVKKHYRIFDDSKESFLLRMSLNFMNQKVPSQLNWSTEDIVDVVHVAIKDHRTRCLALLIESYDTKEEVMALLRDYTGIDLQSLKNGNIVALLKAVHIKMDLEKQDGCMTLFVNALEKRKLKASLFYWTQLDNLIGSALIASYFLKQMLQIEQDQSAHNKLTLYKNTYQNLALDTLYACYKENILSTWILLIKQIPFWGKESCITIAMKTNNRQFIKHKACTDLNDYVWNNYQGQQLQELEPATVFNKSKKALKYIHSFEKYFLSPKSRCRLDVVGYLIFLTSFSILLVSILRPDTFHWLEAVVMGYMCILFIKEMDQVYQQRREYKLETYNILDLISILAAAVAWVFRWIAYHSALNSPQQNSLMAGSRFVFCIDFILYTVRLTEYFYENRLLGPILVKLGKMMKIYIPFLLILFLFLVAYSVASESLLYPETPLNAYILYYIFRKGFWAMIGDYRLDELEVEEKDCTHDIALYSNHSMLRCPSVEGRYAIPVLLGAYSLFVQILMFSLIIALFNFAITRKEEQNEMIWRYQRFLLSEQYSRCRILLPPFLPLYLWLMYRVGQPYRSTFEETEADSGIKEFENMAAQVITSNIIDGRISVNSKDYFYEEEGSEYTDLSRTNTRRISGIQSDESRIYSRRGWSRFRPSARLFEPRVTFKRTSNLLFDENIVRETDERPTSPGGDGIEQSLTKTQADLSNAKAGNVTESGFIFRNTRPSQLSFKENDESIPKKRSKSTAKFSNELFFKDTDMMY